MAIVDTENETESESTDSDTDTDGLVVELERIDGNVNGLYNLFADLRDRITELEEQNERQQMMLESLRTEVATPDVQEDGGSE